MKRFLVIFLLGIHSYGYGSARKDQILELANGKGIYKEYAEPFLITQTVRETKLPPEQAIQAILENLKKNPVTLESYAVPKEMNQEDQQEALQECNAEKCNVKVSAGADTKRIEKSKNKNETYGEIVKERLKKYIDSKIIVGYEKVPTTHQLVAKMIDVMPEFRKSLPKVSSYLGAGLWASGSRPDSIRSNFLRHEVVTLDAKKLQPVERLSEAFEFEEGDLRGVFEVHIYTNHYFDSSMRVFEVAEKAVSVTDVMEVDELKKSGFIRFLYKGKMQEGVLKSQGEELAKMGFK